MRESFLARRARLRRIAARFPWPPSLWCYVIGKLALDPAYRAVLEHLRGSSRPIVDVGCGLGLLAHYLRDHGCQASFVGCDLDARKIALAAAATRRGRLANVSFRCADAADALHGPADVVLLDVLHYLDAGRQRRLLERLAARVASGEGRVIIRTTPRERSWRYGATVLEEYWTRLSRWIPVGGAINFPSRDAVLAPFLVAGCRCDVRPLWGCTPFNSHLFVFAPARAGALAQV
jgi:2-polyprenyl-3-methyl-5-hydroxy-6-metoxy-1,4-benzoquinol methylase